MKNRQTFVHNLHKAVNIRTHIQDVLRDKYKKFKRAFQRVSGDDGKVLKHLVDMYHYRAGGYPNETSPPKHTELLDKFAQFVQAFEFIGLKDSFIDDYLKRYGITVKISPNHQMENFTLTADQIEYCNRVLGKDVLKIKNRGSFDFKQFLKQVILRCDGLQGEICANSNEIRKNLAPVVEKACEIRKGDFSNTVMFNYRNETHRVNGKEVDKIKLSIRSKADTGTYNIQQIKKELETAKHVTD